jgi:hypothetical protein
MGAVYHDVMRACGNMPGGSLLIEKPEPLMRVPPLLRRRDRRAFVKLRLKCPLVYRYEVNLLAWFPCQSVFFCDAVHGTVAKTLEPVNTDSRYEKGREAPFRLGFFPTALVK